MIETPEVAERQTSRKKLSPRSKKILTASGLGVLSAAAFTARQTGVMADLDELPIPGLRSVGESLSHPVLGYVSAWIATSGLKRMLPGRDKLAVPSAITAGTIANFTTEFAQDIILRANGNLPFLSEEQRFETIKDYAFALGGVGLYLWQSRRDTKQLS